LSAQQQSTAVAIARAHIEAWSNHDFDAARSALAPDVRVTAVTTQPVMPPTDLTGAGDYMTGLTQFARGVVPGSLNILAATGDDHNALLMLTVQADLGGGKVTVPGARLYLLDDNNKIRTEHVIFYPAQQ